MEKLFFLQLKWKTSIIQDLREKMSSIPLYGSMNDSSGHFQTMTTYSKLKFGLPCGIFELEVKINKNDDHTNF